MDTGSIIGDGMSKVVMKDIAKELNVSVVAVSKALNDQKGIGESLKKKIKSKAIEMGYQGTGGKFQENGKTKIIGVVIPKTFIDQNINFPIFYLEFYQIISEALQANGYYSILYTLSVEDEMNVIMPSIVTEKKVDGIVFLAELARDYLEVVDKIAIPKVYLDFYGNNMKIDCVTTDNYLGSYDLTCELISKGHKEIGFVGTLGTTSSISDRYLGFQKAMLEHGLRVEQDWNIDDRDNNNRFIDLELPETLPSAFVCNTDKVAYELIQTLKKRDLSVPEEISVVGFDDDPYSRICDPRITTVGINKDEMVKTAVDFLLAKLEDDSLELGKVSIKGALVKRDSIMEM